MNIRKRRGTAVAVGTLVAVGLLATGCSAGGTGSSGAPEEGPVLGALSIDAPSGAGSGYDQTARAIEQVLTSERLAQRVQVTNTEGAGGTVALAEFVGMSSPDDLMIGGLSLVGASITNDAPNDLTELTPVARLIGEYDVIVVPDASPYETLQDFLDALAESPGDNPIAIGNQGGYDHMWGGLLAQDAGLEATDVNFVTFDGGGEALIALLGNQVAAGISGYGEFADSIETGELRVLATASDEPLEVAPDLPSIADAGYPDSALVNWRGIFAPPGISDEDLATLEEGFATLVESDAWNEIRTTNGWSDEYLDSEEFAAELQEQTESTRQLLEDLGLV
ncbi:Bug family tripartite tricarboxylate transporter substrate binding protein [Agrococcus terreus]|uniref:C4-dicarboxylate ABC transporter substrate-binding protein n=2 Tax=Agrococcus terreus TaxID=574649 RepID=A0ABQ2KKU0_9MICO|nr:C4-dicarboxylate ABC transporter substrate-binding protein [Agrococcus terreus]